MEVAGIAGKPCFAHGGIIGAASGVLEDLDAQGILTGLLGEHTEEEANFIRK